MNYLKLSLLLTLLLWGKIAAYSQNGFSADRIFTGGDVRVDIGNVETVIELSPIVGYRFTEKLRAGVGLTYIYYENKNFNFSSNVYGGRLFGQYNIWENLFAHTELELLNLGRYDLAGNSDRIFVPGVLVGGGYQQSLGGNSGASVMILYNITQSPYTPYPNPVIRIGFNIGL